MRRREPAMRNRIKQKFCRLIGLILLGWIAFLSPNPAAAQSALADEGITVLVENPLALARPDETITLPWADLQGRVSSLQADRVRLIDVATGEEVAHQLIDGNTDGQIDELIFQASFWPHQKRSFRVEVSPSELKPASRAYAAHIPERDDLAWENDRIAFRTYGQGLWKLENLFSSGIDVWLKRTRDLVIDRWYSPDHGSYHVDTGEGADFYKVGPTLGAGGTAVWQDDQLYRAENFAAYRILANGPLRTIVELEYAPREVGGITLTEVKRITMDGGHYLYRQETWFQANDRDSLIYATGTVKREGLVGSTNQDRSWAWLSTWGPVDPSAGGHGNMGTAALLSKTHLVAFKETDDHYLALSTARVGEPDLQYAGAAWTASGDFDTVEDWWAYLDTFIQCLETPLRVTIEE